MVGLLEWLHTDDFSSFPTEHRKDVALVDTFRARGVPAEQILYLANEAATTSGIRKAVTEHLSRAGAGDTLVLYFCGHGTLDDDGSAYFASYDAGSDGNPGWAMRSVVGTVDKHFPGSHALLMADCCHSGVLAEEVKKEKGRIAYASLASSLASELSTGNWTFTEQVIAGFGGLAFADDDASGSITLGELGGQIVETMAFAEDQMATFAIGGDFDANMVLAPARRRPHPDVGRRVEALSGDSWYRAQIVDASDGTFRVHYFGYPDSDDEWVTPDQIRDLTRHTYDRGAAVEVKWKSKWFPAKVLDVQHGIHQIAYDGFGPEWNEWLGESRIRERG